VTQAKVRWRRAGAAFAALSLVSCTGPVTLSPDFSPRAPNASAAQPAEHACRVRLAEFHDELTDPGTMGSIGFRPIRADTAAWVRSGLGTLARDPRIQFVDGGQADLDLNVSLLKAYMISITTEKSANVVLRIRYTRPDASSDEQVYRGVDTGLDWAGTTDETQGALDDALAEALASIQRDVLARCPH